MSPAQATHPYYAGMTAIDPALGQPTSYPRQEAATRHFRLGQPRGFRLASDRVVFIRSAGGRDPVGSLWSGTLVGEDLIERRVVDALELVSAEADLPDEEKARRERMRETTAGITAYSADDGLTTAVFSIDGTPYVVSLVDGAAIARELPHPGPVVDPRMSPDGRLVAYVCERALYIVPADGSSEPRALRKPENDDQSWGLADFIAAEELDRYRGFWWLPASDALLVEFVDESDVEIRWISDPSQPVKPAHPHRYPAAGTANPLVHLVHITLDGGGADLPWDHDAYPYLATVEAGDERAAIVSVLSRDQQRQQILRIPTGTADVEVLKERHTEPWLTTVSGVPALSPSGELLEVIANITDDCFQLVSDDRALSPVGLNVTAVLDVSDARIVALGSRDPHEQHVLSIGYDGAVIQITDGPTYNSATADADGIVVAAMDGALPGTRYCALLGTSSVRIPSLAETPVVDPVVHFYRVGERSLSCAVLWPTGHVPGSGPLPVVMAPYGGPHHARVVRAAGSFASDQWLADQGFAVVVVDGRGTPGRGPRWEFSVTNDLADVVLQDQVDALQALGDVFPDLDLTRVGIIGWSFGGYLAALAVLDRPDVFHVAVAGAPVTEWRLYDTAYTERYLGHPEDNASVYDANSLLRRAGQLSRPLLIVHGLADDNVLVANTLQLSSALLAAGKEHYVVPLSGVTHMTPQEDVAENLLMTEVRFLKAHLA